MEEINETTGYVRMWRALTEHPIWHHKEPEYYFLFQLLFTRALYSGPKRGTLLVSAKTLADLMPAHFGINRDRIRTMLLNLEKWSMVSNHPTKAGCQITVTNYDRYQADANKIEATKLKKAAKKANLAQISHLGVCGEMCETKTAEPVQTLGGRCGERCEANSIVDNKNQFNSTEVTDFSEESRTKSRTTNTAIAVVSQAINRKAGTKSPHLSPHPEYREAARDFPSAAKPGDHIIERRRIEDEENARRHAANQVELKKVIAERKMLEAAETGQLISPGQPGYEGDTEVDSECGGGELW